jgi:hypothetical protein
VLLDDRLQLSRAIHSGRNLRHSSNIPLQTETTDFFAFSAKCRS